MGGINQIYQKYNVNFNDYTNNITPNSGLLETKPCIAWAQVTYNQKINPSSDAQCVNLDNGYTGSSGCCRTYWWLIMDAGTGFPQLPCICNQFTRDPASFTGSTPGLPVGQIWTTPFPTPFTGTAPAPATAAPVTVTVRTASNPDMP
jgi:hypothetical protein